MHDQVPAEELLGEEQSTAGLGEHAHQLGCSLCDDDAVEVPAWFEGLPDTVYPFGDQLQPKHCQDVAGWTDGTEAHRYRARTMDTASQ